MKVRRIGQPLCYGKSFKPFYIRNVSFRITKGTISAMLSYESHCVSYCFTELIWLNIMTIINIYMLWKQLFPFHKRINSALLSRKEFIIKFVKEDLLNTNEHNKHFFYTSWKLSSIHFRKYFHKIFFRKFSLEAISKMLHIPWNSSYSFHTFKKYIIYINARFFYNF